MHSLAYCMGGALLRKNDWNNYRICIYVLAGIYEAAALGIAIGYNNPPRKLQASLTTSEKLKRLDWIGCALSAIGLILFCVVLS